MDEVANHIATNLKHNDMICACRHILFICLFLGIQLAYGQESIFDLRLNINLTNRTTYEVLKTVEEEISYNFSYDADIIDANKIISVNSQSESLRNILNYIFNDSTLIYKIVDKHIVIYRDITDIQEYYTILVADSIPVLEIRGKIIDKNTQSPIEYANIGILGKSIGTISNSDGDFVLKIPPAYINDTIGISCIGYKIFAEPAINYLPETRVIPLIPDFIPIQEVIIRKIDPISLLNSAIDKISVNYSNSNSLLTSFYRESVRESKRYIFVAEAVLQTFKSSYSESYIQDQIKIVKARTSKDLNRNDSIVLKLKAGLSTTLLLDIVKNPANFLTTDFFKFYKYKMADVMIDNDKEAYVIKFEHRNIYEYPLFIGRIYLDLNSLAIKSVDFSLDKNRIEKAADFLVVKKPRNYKVKPLKAEYQVKFRELNNKYYLNFIRCETEFRIRKKKQLFGVVFNTVIEMAVTDIDTTDVKRFKGKEIAKTMDIFTEQVNEYDDSFWEEYNFIKPDEPLEEAIKKLNPDIENLNN